MNSQLAIRNAQLRNESQAIYTIPKGLDTTKSVVPYDLDKF